MKYLKYFKEASAYEAYKTGSDYVLPNVSYVVEMNGVIYEPPFKIEIPSPYIEYARIQHIDGTLYTADEWNAAKTKGTVTNKDANGVAVLYNSEKACPHIIYFKDSSNSLKWTSAPSNANAKLIPGIEIPETYNLRMYTAG